MIAVISALAAWIGPLLATLTGQLVALGVVAGVIVLQRFTDIFSIVGAWLLERLFLLFINIATAFVEILPVAPDQPPANLQPLLDALTVANRYLPMSEAFTALALAGTVISSLWIYKLAKFGRGGG